MAWLFYVVVRSKLRRVLCPCALGAPINRSREFPPRRVDVGTLSGAASLTGPLTSKRIRASVLRQMLLAAQTRHGSRTGFLAALLAFGSMRIGVESNDSIGGGDRHDLVVGGKLRVVRRIFLG